MKLINNYYLSWNRKQELWTNIRGYDEVITKEDEKLLKIGINMLTSFDEELQSAESLREFSEFIDIEKLTENWEEVKNRANTTSMAVPDSIHFGRPLDEMIDEMGSPDEDD